VEGCASGAGTVKSCSKDRVELRDDLSNEVTGCCSWLATAESESQALCQLVEPRSWRFLASQQQQAMKKSQPAMRKSQAACLAARRLKMNRRAAAMMIPAGISPKRA
jgi:hypothetical protein